MSEMTAKQFAGAMLKYSRILPYCAPNFEHTEVVEFWYEELGHYGIEILGKAFKGLVCKGKFPSINEVKAACGDEPVTDDAVGRDVAERIWSGIIRYGSQDRWPEIEAHIGELGVKVVGGQVGWKFVCDAATYANSATMKAQWRESTKGHIEMQKKGMTGPPKLPEVNPNVALLAERVANGLVPVK